MAASDLDPNILIDQAGAATASAPEPEPENEDDLGGAMTLVEHLEELRRRIIISLIAIGVCSVIGFIFWNQILGFLLTPLPAVADHLRFQGVGQGPQLVASSITEPFMVALKLAVAMGIIIASPVVLYQMWGFIYPGLTRRERRYAVPFTALGVGLFVVGIAVGFIVLRFPVNWLVSFGENRFVLLLDAGSYFTFVAYFLLAFGVVFELPLVLTFLGVVGVINSRMLRQKRIYILFGLWVLSCFITPGADPYSPIIIAVCFTLLFELTILLLRILHK